MITLSFILISFHTYLSLGRHTFKIQFLFIIPAASCSVSFLHAQTSATQDTLLFADRVLLHSSSRVIPDVVVILKKDAENATDNGQNASNDPTQKVAMRTVGWRGSGGRGRRSTRHGAWLSAGFFAAGKLV